MHHWSSNHLEEWGFAALVEADGRRLPFDTGARPETVLNDARELGIDMAVLPARHDPDAFRIPGIGAGSRPTGWV
jgi:metal-dependent hydrolase (beta-lactamase superfamily II)